MMAMVDVVLLVPTGGALWPEKSLCPWSKGRPSGAVRHSSCELGVQRPCDFLDMLRRLINCRIIIISAMLLGGCLLLPPLCLAAQNQEWSGFYCPTQAVKYFVYCVVQSH